MTAQWDPAQYDLFKEQRSQPFFDLLDMVRPKRNMNIVDLGCGTGELTHRLHQKLKAAQTLGIDSSESMLAESAQHTADGLRFARGDIAQLVIARGSLDLLYSNAALHWLPDHRSLFSLLWSWLGDGGQLAIQVPSNHLHPAHRIAQTTAQQSPFAEAMAHFVRAVPVLDLEEYCQLLFDLGCAEQQTQLRIYAHVLVSSEQVVQWVRGTLLLEYLKRLPEDLHQSYLEQYRINLLQQIGLHEPYLYQFKRVFLWARKS